MIETIQFYIPKDKFTYSFEIETDDQFVFLDQSLRHPDFSHPMHAMTQLLQKQEFHHDLNFFLRRLNIHVGEIDTDSIQKAFIEICEDHIRRHGRLFYVDLLIYADLYINVDRAIYHRNQAQYQLLYRKGVYIVLNKFPNQILFQNPFGRGCITWAEKKEADEYMDDLLNEDFID